MTTLAILRYPDKRLHTVAKPVVQFDGDLKRLVDDMIETMYESSGVGLAATQVDRHVRVVVMDISDTRNEPRIFINPEITWRSEEKMVYDEGCLSVPGVYDGVERHAKIKARALDVTGQAFELAADGLLAVCIQHELDHLNGIVFVEYLSPLKRNRIKTRLLKEQHHLDRESERRQAPSLPQREHA